MCASALSLLEYAARHHPDKPAIIDETGTFTFAELREGARRCGSALIERGCAGRPVIVLLDKGFHALVAMMGALYAGGFYIPIDPATAPLRLAPIHHMLGSPIVIIDDSTRALLNGNEKDAFAVDELLHANSNDIVLERICSRTLGTDPAYVLFTSGSTGVPKGVAVSHRAIVDFIHSFTHLFGIDERDVIANQAPFDFDVSVKDIYGAMAAGATLLILPRRLFSEPARLVETLVERKATTLTWAVAALCLVSGLHALEGTTLEGVRHVLFSGETMPLDHLATWLDRAPNAEFVNLYGPTEVTCNCLYHRIDRARSYAAGIPLGDPLPNHEVLLLDENNRPITQPGCCGELYVRTPQLALGYFGDAHRTAEAFVQNPLNPHLPETTYRTGDLARLTEDGELVFCGRRDNQIKHRGHRIELEEIDVAIERADGVGRCRCSYDEHRHRIIAFYEGSTEPDALARFVRAALPAHLAPSALIPVEHMPLTKNGKVDRRALLDSVCRRRSR